MNFTKKEKMFSKIPYYIVDFIVKILTFNLFVIKRLIKPYRNVEDILDLGCGVGAVAPLFNKNGYLGIDVNKISIAYARRKNPGYNFEVADITNFKLNKKYSLVLIIGVLHHLSDIEVLKVIERANFHLKKNGKVVIVEAIHPLHRWNLIGQFLRDNDSGQFIRSTEEYKYLVGKKFSVKKARSILGGFFDYAFLVGTI